VGTGLPDAPESVGSHRSQRRDLGSFRDLPARQKQPGKSQSGRPPHQNLFINKDIRIYGDFSGTESSRDERDWASNVTVLSGDIGAANNSADNSYHVAWINYHTNAMVRGDSCLRMKTPFASCSSTKGARRSGEDAGNI
jgi:hypothetical protein